IVEAHAQRLRRVSGNDRVGWHVPGHYRLRADHRAVADVHARQDDRARADPHVVADRDAAAGDVRALATNRSRPQARQVVERVGRHPIGAVIAAEEDLDPVGDRAIAADGELRAGFREAERRTAVAVFADGEALAAELDWVVMPGLADRGGPAAAAIEDAH